MTTYSLTDLLTTGGRHVENPAWDYVKNVPQDTLFAGFRALGSSEPEFTPANYSYDKEDIGGSFISYRDQVTLQWTWAIPSPESLAFVASVLNGRPVVEIGAGAGYWAWMLTQLGVEVNAYDKAPVGHEDSWFSREKLLKMGKDPDLFTIQEFHPVSVGGPEAVTLPENQGRVLFLCWPYMNSMAAEAVRLYEGDTVIYIGEGPGGCTADSSFFQLVGVNDTCDCWGGEGCACVVEPAMFEETETGPLTQWSGLHDYISVHHRKA